MSDLTLERTPIPGLLVLRLPIHGDDRGWFKENWQREKMTALGLPDFGPVQNNISFNAAAGATRGIHAEPWDKLVSVATGRVFGAWVDLREGESFGTTFTITVNPGTCVFVPRGVGNSYQALEDGTAYSYLVNDHWRPGITYPAVNLGDAALGIAWPIPLSDAEISPKDLANPVLAEVPPFPPRRALIIGANGQLGRALAVEFPQAHRVGHQELDITDPAAVAAWPWRNYDVILNAAAYTAVDEAETPEGRPIAWAANATAPALLANAVRDHGLTLVHYSSDYVFDGKAAEHTEDEPLSPLGVYGQSKAAGDLAVMAAPKHFILRTSWVIGDGNNFVRTMRRLAEAGVSPSVVCDQVGRLTFTDELARATVHLLDTGAPFGIYNVTNSGRAQSWADLARSVFALSARNADDITPVNSDEYAAGKPTALRPRNSLLSLEKLGQTGFISVDAADALKDYLGLPPRSVGQ